MRSGNAIAAKTKVASSAIPASSVQAVQWLLLSSL
jgi:hypothetical protein